MRVSTLAVAKDASRVVALGKLTVVPRILPVPPVAPKVYKVAAPPILSVVAPELKRLPVEDVVVIEPPLIAAEPAEVMLPFEPFTLKFVPLMSLAPNERAVPMAVAETSSAVVIAPPPEEVILIPAGRVLVVALLSSKSNWFGTVEEAPSARERMVETVEPLAVVMVKLESVVVSANV